MIELTGRVLFLSYLSKDRVSPKGSRPARGCLPEYKKKEEKKSTTKTRQNKNKYKVQYKNKNTH